MATIKGTNNNDILNGTAGADLIYGYDGDDVIYGNDGDDEAYGGTGNDELYGGAGNDTLGGGAGNDIIDGGIGNDILYGGAGDDILIGGAGADTFYGGDGIDTVSYENYGGSQYGEGVTVYLDNSGISYDSDAAGDIFNSIENIKGSRYADTIYGDSGDNIIWGNGGNDYLHGFSQNAYQQSGDISDLFGGNDIFYTGSRAGDWPSVSLGLGNNIVYGGDGDEHIERVDLPVDQYIASGLAIGKTTLHLGEGNNRVGSLQAIGEFEITAGSGDDYISFSGPDFYEKDLSYLTGNIVIDAGNGDNYVFFGYNTIAIDVTTGSGNDSIQVQRYGHHHHQGDLSLVPFGDIIINSGNGNDQISVDNIGYVKTNINSGNGDDQISISGQNDLDAIAPLNGVERLVDSGAGNDIINLAASYLNLNTGSENDTIEVYFNVQHVNIDAGTGDDLVKLNETVSDTVIDLGDGNDVIEINYKCSNLDVIGGQGDDIYDMSYINQAENIIIDNYDTDSGFDILKIGYSIDSLSAELQGDDLVISSNIYTFSTTIENYALGSDYQIDEFQIEGSSYTSDQFLAEMGLTI